MGEKKKNENGNRDGKTRTREREKERGEEKRAAKLKYWDAAAAAFFSFSLFCHGDA